MRQGDIAAGVLECDQNAASVISEASTDEKGEQVKIQIVELLV